MTPLESLLPQTAVQGVLPNSVVTVVSVQWFGTDAIELTYKDPSGKVANELLYRADEARLAVVAQAGARWSFAGDGATFRLASEAQRIRLAHLFDPVSAHPHTKPHIFAHIIQYTANKFVIEFITQPNHRQLGSLGPHG